MFDLEAFLEANDLVLCDYLAFVTDGWNVGYSSIPRQKLSELTERIIKEVKED